MDQVRDDLTWLYFAFCALCAAAIAGVFVIAWWRRRRAASLVVTHQALCVVVWMLRENHWIHLWPARIFIATTGPLLLFGLFIAFNSERQR